MVLEVMGRDAGHIALHAGIAGGAFFLIQTLMATTNIKKFDKTQAKYVSKAAFKEEESL